MFRQTLALLFAAGLYAQSPGLTLPPSGNNQKASVTQFIGPVRVSIDYSSPAVHAPNGQDRRGKIFGQLVPYGLTKLGFGNGKPGPWRAGANENTVFTVSHPVTIDGKSLPAGRYGLHMIADPTEWTILFSKNSASWGSFFYEEADDVLRVKVKPHKNEYREYLTYEFVSRKPTEATVELRWEELAVPFTVGVPDVNSIYLSRLKQELTSVAGFTPQGFLAAAQFTLQNNTNLEQGLQWVEGAIRAAGGVADFQMLFGKSMIQARMGRDADAKKTAMEAIRLPGASALQIHSFARQLTIAKRYDDAVEMWLYNAQRFGEELSVVNVGLARAYSIKGDLPKALDHARKALAKAPDPINKASLEAMVQRLSQGQKIEQ